MIILSPSTTKQFFARKILVIGLGVGVVLFGTGLAGLHRYYQTRFLHGTEIDSIAVGGMQPDQVNAILQARQLPLDSSMVFLEFEDSRWSTPAASLNLHRTINSTVAQAFNETHPPSIIDQLTQIIAVFFKEKTFLSSYKFDESAVESFVESVRPAIEIAGATPSATLQFSGSPGSLTIERGSFGRALLTDSIVRELLAAADPDDIAIQASVASTSSVLSDAEIEEYQNRVAPLIGRAARLESEYGSIVIDDTTLVKLVAYPRGLHQAVVAEVLSDWEARFTKEAQDAEFEFDPETLEVTTFIPDRPKISLDSLQASSVLEDAIEYELTQAALSEDTTSEPYFAVQLPLKTTPATRTLADINTLGITERIAFGESEYFHSIPTRIHNVAHTSKILNNILVPPGEEFSFNKALGEVSRATGFQPAYVIRNGQTELGDGGGVCQVSTTLFRALLDGGLLVTKRLPHSYRVSYYELNAKPGLDATVYAGEVDLRFKNDTNNHLLIHTTVDSENLYMSVEIYGTSDGRSAEITEHLVWGSTPPLPTQYIPDPSLAPGKRKQIDWAVGGVKASYINVIKDKNGEVIREDKYYSNYRPWAAKYLVGVEPE